MQIRARDAHIGVPSGIPHLRQRPATCQRMGNERVPPVSPNTTLLRKLSLPSKESARRMLDLMRFREIGILFDVGIKNKESAS